jgi:hypothetical protein
VQAEFFFNQAGRKPVPRHVLPFSSGTHDNRPFNLQHYMVKKKLSWETFSEERDRSGSTFEDQEVPCVYTK